MNDKQRTAGYKMGRRRKLKRSGFNPDQKFLEKAKKEFLKKGGKIEILEDSTIYAEDVGFANPQNNGFYGHSKTSFAGLID